MKNYEQIKYRFRISLGMILDISFILGFISLALVFFIIGQKEGFEFGIIIFILLFLFLGLLPLSLFLNYLSFSLNKRIIIDKLGGLIHTHNYWNIRNEKIENINSIEIYELIDSRLIPFDFCYAKYFLSNGTNFIVTSFMTNTFYIPDGVKPKIVETLFPRLNGNEKQIVIKTEKEIYLEQYENFSNNELEEIVNSKNGYRKNAFDAAIEIIEKRKSEKEF